MVSKIGGFAKQRDIVPVALAVMLLKINILKKNDINKTPNTKIQLLFNPIFLKVNYLSINNYLFFENKNI